MTQDDFKKGLRSSDQVDSQTEWTTFACAFAIGSEHFSAGKYPESLHYEFLLSAL